jgi:cytochrome c oxidase subunit 4
MTKDANPHSLLTYVGLVALLGTSILLSRLPLSPLRDAAILSLAALQGLLMMIQFMRVRFQGHLIWVVAGASFVWLGILFALSLGDYLSRELIW